MAKRGRPKKVRTDETLNLMDVGPANAKEIVRVAKQYRATEEERLEALAQETKLKERLLSLIRASGLKRLEDGTIRFTCEGLLIKVTPRDDLVQVKNEKSSEDISDED
jgi:hypothetical protein